MAALRTCVMRKVNGAYNRIFGRQSEPAVSGMIQHNPHEGIAARSTPSAILDETILDAAHRISHPLLQLPQEDSAGVRSNQAVSTSINPGSVDDSQPSPVDTANQQDGHLCSHCRKRKANSSIDTDSSRRPSSSSKRACHADHDRNDEPTELPYGNPVKFNGEDATDYTTGPIRIIEGTDQTQHCATLLLNLDLSLSTKIQRAIRNRRTFARLRRTTAAEQEANNTFILELQTQILETRISPSESDEVLVPEARLENLKAVLAEAEARARNLDTSLTTHLTESHRLNCLVSSALEEAFIYANLLEAADERPDTPVRSFEILAEVRRLREHDEHYRQHGGAAYWDDAAGESAELDADAEVREMLAAEYRQAEHRLYEAEDAFENREHTRENERIRHAFAAEQGHATVDASSEAFDVRWVARYRELTRELIEAEEGLERVRCDAEAQGAGDIIQEVESDGSRGDEVGEMSREQVAVGYMGYVDREKIEGWLGALEGARAPDLGVEADVDVGEWESEELLVGDGLSAFAEGKDKAQILKWRGMCGH